METVRASLGGLPDFLAFLATAAALTLLYVVIYVRVTPHPEMRLIRENNLAAALAFGGSLLGFSLPLANTVASAFGVIDCIIWGTVAIVVQIAVYYLASLSMPGLSARIAKGETASGLWLGATSLAGGILNAACMTY